MTCGTVSSSLNIHVFRVLENYKMIQNTFEEILAKIFLNLILKTKQTKQQSANLEMQQIPSRIQIKKTIPRRIITNL